MTRVPKPGPAARPHGPYETEREAARAARALGGPLRDGYSILSAEQNRELLTAACAAAGVTPGSYDERILSWLAGFEDSTCAMIAGLINRARQAGYGDWRESGVRAGLTREQLRTMLSALDAAADAKRDAADVCSDCDARPDGALCGTCEYRLGVADDYDKLAEELRQRP